MKQTLPIILFVISVLFYSCEKYEKPLPEPVTATFTEPGVLQFTVKQWSWGSEPQLHVDSMYLKIKNQSVFTTRSIRYSIRGFKNGIKEYQNLDFWMEDTYVKSIRTFDTTSYKINNSYASMASSENMEIDLISFKRDNQEIKNEYSGMYDGTFIVLKDSSFYTHGQQFSWIDYKGKLTSYFDRGENSWRVLNGYMTEDSLFYGQIKLGDTSFNVKSKLTTNYSEALILNFDFAPDTLHTYQFTIKLNK